MTTTKPTETKDTTTNGGHGLEIRKGKGRFEVYRDGQIINTFLSLTTATKFVERLKAEG